MKIRALCVVKNEADIIAQTLRAAAAWCDRIYGLDNGSDDGTWELVQQLAAELPAVRPFKQLARPFEDSIRDIILRQFAREAAHGDWWCILDADEFYIDDPRLFLTEVPKRDQSVYMLRYTYLFTDRDHRRFQDDPLAFSDHIPIEQRLRHYVVGEYSEMRFFRHHRRIRHVPMNSAFPAHGRLIRLKHYAYRSPQQIWTRLETRREPMERGEFVHEKKANWVPDGVVVPGPATADDLPQSWMERIARHEECHVDPLDGNYVAGPATARPPADAAPPIGRRSLAGRLRRWGEALVQFGSVKAIVWMSDPLEWFIAPLGGLSV
jgi:hypothetical protein